MEKFPTEEVLEQKTEDGLGLIIKRKVLYHGSATPGIEVMNLAEEDTVGSGVYFTSEEKDANGYAKRRSRSKKESSPILYTASIENLKLLDLRQDENVKKILVGFKNVLEEKLKDPKINWAKEAAINNAIEAINLNKVSRGNLREVAFSFGTSFSEYCRSLGYDGLITFEGGEGEDIGDHDTYLIFDPERAKIIESKEIEK